MLTVNCWLVFLLFLFCTFETFSVANTHHTLCGLGWILPAWITLYCIMRQMKWTEIHNHLLHTRMWILQMYVLQMYLKVYSANVKKKFHVTISPTYYKKLFCEHNLSKCLIHWHVMSIFNCTSLLLMPLLHRKNSSSFLPTSLM